MLDVFKKKQMYHSVITGKDNVSKDWDYILYRCFWRVL